jgi:hypothetical protein
MPNLLSSGSSGRAGSRRPRGAWLSVLAVAAMLALGVPNASVAAVRAAGSPQAGTTAQMTAAQTTEQYVIRFWNRWITYFQQMAFPRVLGVDRLGGPRTMGPPFRVVNLINDDTLYTAGVIDLSHGPLVLTIPPTKVTYSILPLTVFQEVFPVSIKPHTPGHYALVLKGWKGTLPKGLTKVVIPFPLTFWNVRADYYSDTGKNMIKQAHEFRSQVHLASLAEYEANPDAGPVTIRPVRVFALSIKLVQDTSALLTPIAYLRQTQRVVASPTTLPFSTPDATLSQEFNQVFAAALRAAAHGNPIPLLRIKAAVRSAYAAIVANYKTHVGPTNWVFFNNFADWGTTPQDFLDRASASEFCQLCNNIGAAAYYTAFTDGTGRTLNGALHSYKLTFPADNIPDAKRFWSVTAYLPRTLALVPNRAHKYLVARYTPGLVTNPNGSITIWMAPRKPAGVPMANWLPVPRRQFLVTLRVYGPTGNTAGGDYTPPAITPIR